MRPIDTAFGPLRGILDRGPSRAAFGDLLALLSEWSGHEAFGEKLFPYVVDALATWPDASRVLTHEDFARQDTRLFMLGRRVDAWFFCHDTNPHSGAPLLQVMRLLPDLSVGCAPVQARSLTPSTLSWLDGTTGNATTGTYTFDGDALTYAIYIGNRQQPDALIEGEGVVASGGFEVATHSHATDFHDQRSYRVFSDAHPATVPS